MESKTKYSKTRIVGNYHLLSINAVSKMLGIGYDKTKQLISAGEIKSINVQGKFRVPIFRLKEYMDTENALVYENKQLCEQDELAALSIISNLKIK